MCVMNNLSKVVSLPESGTEGKSWELSRNLIVDQISQLRSRRSLQRPLQLNYQLDIVPV